MTVKEFERRATYQGGYDRIIDNWKIIDIHEIPESFLETSEIDFYCCNGKKVVLLRLRNRANENYSIIETDKVIYWIAEFSIYIFNNELLQLILMKFESKQN